MSSDVRAYIGTNYVDTGKRVSFNQTLSGDGLQLTYTSVYRDEASKNELRNDSTVATEVARRDQVNTNNSISGLLYGKSVKALASSCACNWRSLACQ